MKTIIAGSRKILSYGVVCHAIRNSQFNITEVVSGRASGVDQLGERWADENHIPIKPMPADWSPKKPGQRYDKSAGYKRNVEMAKYADALIAVRSDLSKGTTHMINIAKKEGLKIYVLDLQTTSAEQQFQND